MDIREQIKKRGKKVLGLGSALTDMLIQTSDEELGKISDIKGGMTLVESEFIDNCLKKIEALPSVVPGGAACNTMQGLARLGGEAFFLGKRGDDKTGQDFEAALRASGVFPLLSESSTASGRVLSVITPDAQRSMFTCLGASSELSSSDIPDDIFKDVALVFLEGYLFFNADLTLFLLKKAKEAGALVAMDLASFTVIEAAGKLLNDSVKQFVDILIANEDEARAYTGLSDLDKALDSMSLEVPLAVLKLGARGSRIAYKGSTLDIAPYKGGEVLDTTGAGDLWASGFLYGLLEDAPLKICGALASACAYEVCCVIGANIPDKGWERIYSGFFSEDGKLRLS